MQRKITGLLLLLSGLMSAPGTVMAAEPSESSMRVVDPKLTQFVMFSVLFMSAEGAMDVATDGLPHGDDLMYQIDTTKSSSSDTSSESAT